MQLRSTEAQALVIRHPTSSAETLRPCTLRWPLRADFQVAADVEASSACHPGPGKRPTVRAQLGQACTIKLRLEW